MTLSYICKPFQFILGLGLPMEVDVSMIIGYVMKFNYVLPHNVSYLTEPYVRYDRSISHRSQPDGDDVSASATGTHVRFNPNVEFTLASDSPRLENQLHLQQGRPKRAS
jgi:hypothetical protein